MANINSVLTVSSLDIAYEGKQIISDLSFTVEKREILIILGPNGVGKTTLLRALQNFLPYQLSSATRVSATTNLPPIP